MELARADAPVTESLRSGTGSAKSASVSNSVPVVVNSIRTTAARQTNRLLPGEEILVPDQRAELTPAQSVERRLALLLKDAAIPVSHVRMVAHLSRKS
jgi:hypothetical protein